MGKLLRSRWVLFISIGVCLIICRFPVLVAAEMNPDETFFIAAAEKLFKDPVFFRAVDFATSGPLNVYPLMLPAVFGFAPDYASTRLIALLIIFGSIYVIYRALVLLTDDAAARIAILPAAGAFAALKYGDFLGYTSEHVSFLLLALAVYVCARILRRPRPHAWNLAELGVLTSAAFFAKMQAVPILGCVAVVAIAYVHRSGLAGRWWRPSLVFGAALLPLLVLNAIICLWAGVWHDFWMEYIVGNYHYVVSYGTLTSEVQRFADFALGITDIRLLFAGVLAILAAYAYQKTRRAGASDEALFLQTALVGGIVAVAAGWLLSTAGGAMVSYAVMIGMMVLPGSFLLLYRRSDRDPDPVRWFGMLAAAVLAAAIAVAYVPHRPYGHYLLLLVLPLSMVAAWLVVAASAEGEPVVGDNQKGLQRRHARVPFLLVFAALTLAGQVFELGSPDFRAFASVPATVRAPESELIEALTHPAGKITVWGWNGQPYVGAGRVSATNYFIAGQLFVDDPEVRAYYREAYLRAIRREQPELIIDATEDPHGPFDRRNHFDVIPELNSFIRSSYVHVVNAFQKEFYIRRDLARSMAGIGEPRECDTQALRCFVPGAGSWIPADLPRIQMPEHALMEVTFTPETKQDLYATVFSNDDSLTAHQGFQFQHLGHDRYRLAVGWGPEWAVSKELWLPQRRPVYLAIEFNGNTVTVVCNGAKQDEMRLAKRMLDSPGPITVGSWIGHQRPFLGNIQFFQIRSLGQGR